MSADDTSNYTPVTTGESLKSNLEAGTSVILSNNITLNLSDDIEIDSTKHTDPIILDLGNKTLTINKIDNNNSNRLVVAEGATVTIQNGTIIYKGDDGSTAGKSPIRVGSMKAVNSTHSASESTLTLNNVKITSAEYGVAVFGKANLTVNDSNITAVSSAISTNGNPASKAGNSCGSTITINGGQYTSTNTAAIYFPGGDTLDVNGGTFTGKTGFDIRSGTVTIDDATINVFGNPSEVKSGDGPTSWGMGIAVFNMSPYGQNVEGKPTELSISVTNTSINNAVYNTYVGDYKIITSSGEDKGEFDVSNISASYTAQHSLNCSIAVNNETASTPSAIINQSATPTSTLGTRSADGAAPTIDIINKRIFANGISITISNGTNNASKITYGDNITFIDNFDLSKFTIFGGYNNNDTTIASTSITMMGGKVQSVVGGGYGAANVTTSNVSINGGTATYVAGGGWSTDSSTTVTALDAMTNRTTTTHVTITDGDVKYALGGGRLGYAYVETANLTINGGTFDEIVAGGINGYTGKATLTINATEGKSIISGLIASGNRGQVAEANVTITSLGDGGKSDLVSIGALSGLTATDGGPNAIFDIITFDISKDLQGTLDNIYLGGSTWDENKANPWDSRTNSLAGAVIKINALGQTIIAKDIPADAQHNGYDKYASQAVAVDYTINAGKTWTIDGASISDISKITCVDSGKLILKNNPDFVPAPLVDKNIGKIDLSEYKVEKVEKTATATTISVTANDVPKHINGAGTAGYWVGVAIPVPEGAKDYTADMGWNPYSSDSNDNTQLGNKWDGTLVDETGTITHITFYFNAGSDKMKDSKGYIAVDWDGNNATNSPINYTIDLSTVTLGVDVSNISTAPIEDHPAGNDTKITDLVSDYKVILGDINGNTITLNISANDLKMHRNGNNDWGYWVGVAIEVPDGVSAESVKYGFGTNASISANNDYKTFDVINSKNYLTFYVNAGSYAPKTYIAVDFDGAGETYEETIYCLDITGVKFLSNDENAVKLTFNSGYTSGPSDVISYYHSEDKITLPGSDLFTRSNYSFAGWNDGTKTYAAGSEYTVPVAETTLTAVWTYNGGSGGGVPITPPDVPDVPDEPTIIPDNGNVTVPSIDDKKADELVHKAVSSGSDSISIIDTNNVEGEYTEVTVSKSDLETISKKIENNNNINSVSIETSEGDIIIEKEVLNSILETTDADSVSFEIEDAKDKLTEEQKEAVGDRPVYDINIKAGNENITSFNGKTITISLPYTLKAGEDPENIVVYYVKEDGSLEKMNCTYKDGKVIFETDHLSKYVIGYEESDKPVTPDTPDNKKDDNNTIYYAVAAVIVILIIIALAYYFMKKKQ